jgi:hypothetical protein
MTKKAHKYIADAGILASVRSDQTFIPVMVVRLWVTTIQ